VLLTALLYALGIEQRSEETGLLRALGFTKPAIRRIHLAEGAFIALLGGLLGTVLGIIYNVVLLHGLNTLWRDAVGVSSLELFLRPSTLAIGAVSGFAIALLAMWITSARQVIRSPVELQRAIVNDPQGSTRRSLRPLFLFAGAAAAAAAVALAAAGIGETGNPTGRFFLGGALLLASALLGLGVALAGLTRMRGARARRA
jgi:putative ABC transport system permease protein